MKLSELKNGETAVIVRLSGHGGFRKRIMEMGFVKGQEVTVVLDAPLKDPIEYHIMGYDISLRRKEAEMIVVEGTLYPLLIRQKNQGLLSYRWEESPQGPPRKYYMITEKGRQALSEMDNVWRELVQTIDFLRG